MKNYYLNFFLFVAIVFSSCTNYKYVPYFQGIDRNPDLGHKISNFTPLTIQAGDVLAIHVRSLSPEGSAIFNSEINYNSTSGTSAGGAGAGGSGGGSGGSASGYVVDPKGEIQLPLVHSIKVGGLTLLEAENVLQQAITPFLKEPIVTVSLTNFKISVLGEVSRSGIYPIDNDHISIPEVLSLAGDLNVNGKPENILLIREINGERKFVNIDITSKKLFDSPYYYLKNNDILYVESSNLKYKAINQGDRTLPTVLSVISIILLTLSLNKTYIFL